MEALLPLTVKEILVFLIFGFHIFTIDDLFNSDSVYAHQIMIVSGRTIAAYVWLDVRV